MSETTEYRNALPLQSMLFEYRLEAILGAGSFGTTYLGWDTNLEKHVAIKEYLPTELAVRALDGSVVPVTSGHERDYKWGLERFILEARTLAKFGHPHIVRVNRYFESNGTGYMVMDYEKGEPLNEQLRRKPNPDEASLKTILQPLLDGLRAVHQAGFLHRDIKPGNIFIRENSSPVLIDFGAARQAISGATRSLTAVLTPGYAPLEQYSSEARQGPWTDIYAMSGVVYRAITNTNPPDAVSRMRDDSVPLMLATVRGRYSEPFLKAVGWALTMNEKERPQDVDVWKSALIGGQPAPLAAAAVMKPAAAAGMEAATVRLVPRPATAAPQIQRLSRRPPARAAAQPPSKPRWLGIVIVVLAVMAAAAAWNKQRQARTPALPPQIAEPAAMPSPPEPAEMRPEPAIERPPAARVQPRERNQPAPSVARQHEDRGRAPVRDAVALPPIVTDDRGRPSRDRDPRPGDAEQVRTAAAEFRSADRDGDGQLSRDEVRGRFPLIDREFGRVDADGDGRISPQEFQRLRSQQAQAMRGRPQK